MKSAVTVPHEITFDKWLARYFGLRSHTDEIGILRKYTCAKLVIVIGPSGVQFRE